MSHFAQSPISTFPRLNAKAPLLNLLHSLAHSPLPNFLTHPLNLKLVSSFPSYAIFAHTL